MFYITLHTISFGHKNISVNQKIYPDVVWTVNQYHKIYNNKQIAVAMTTRQQFLTPELDFPKAEAIPNPVSSFSPYI